MTTPQFGTAAHKVACIDFDGTIIEWGDLMSAKNMEPGAREVIQRLKDEGYRIVIFTSRASRSWAMKMVGDEADAERFHEEQISYVIEHLNRHGIPYDDITAEKVPAEFYIDDLAHRYRGSWAEIEETLFAPAN